MNDPQLDLGQLIRELRRTTKCLRELVNRTKRLQASLSLRTDAGHDEVQPRAKSWGHDAALPGMDFQKPH
jgi:hypothetical protein